MSLLGIGAELAAPASRTDDDRIIIAERDSLQDTLNQIGPRYPAQAWPCV